MSMDRVIQILVNAGALYVADFGAAFLGAIVVAVVGWILSIVIGAARVPTRAL